MATTVSRNAKHVYELGFDFEEYEEPATSSSSSATTGIAEKSGPSKYETNSNKRRKVGEQLDQAKDDSKTDPDNNNSEAGSEGRPARINFSIQDKDFIEISILNRTDASRSNIDTGGDEDLLNNSETLRVKRADLHQLIEYLGQVENLLLTLT
jgi:hypothetical protein